MGREYKRLDEYEQMMLEASRGVISQETFEFLKSKIMEEVKEAIEEKRINKEEYMRLRMDLEIEFNPM